MKTFLNFLFVLFIVSIFSSGCEKEEPVPEKQTLEKQYSDWSDLTWVNTDGIDSIQNPDIYPRLSISIIDDTITIEHLHFIKEYNIGVTVYRAFHDELIIDGNIVTFKGGIGQVTGTFEKTTTHIKITTKGLIKEPIHEYLLKIN